MVLMSDLNKKGDTESREIHEEDSYICHLNNVTISSKLVWYVIANSTIYIHTNTHIALIGVEHSIWQRENIFVFFLEKKMLEKYVGRWVMCVIIKACLMLCSFPIMYRFMMNYCNCMLSFFSVQSSISNRTCWLSSKWSSRFFESEMTLHIITTI